MLKHTFLFIVLSSTFSMYSQEWQQDNTQTKVIFEIKNFGLNVKGNFDEVKISTNLNVNELTKSYINAVINVKSITTEIESRDKHLLKEDYFDETNYNTIQLESTKIEKQQEGIFLLFANLTIKGITKKIKVPLEVIESEKNLTITAIFNLNRKEFNIGGSSFVMSKSVKVKVVYNGTK